MSRGSALQVAVSVPSSGRLRGSAPLGDELLEQRGLALVAELRGVVVLVLEHVALRPPRTRIDLVH